MFILLGVEVARAAVILKMMFCPERDKETAVYGNRVE